VDSWKDVDVKLDKRDNLVAKRAQEIFNQMKPRCDRGGCDYHSGHEYCSVESAWDAAYDQADNEIPVDTTFENFEAIGRKLSGGEK
jgi:hypothetical protein